MKKNFSAALELLHARGLPFGSSLIQRFTVDITRQDTCMRYLKRLLWLIGIGFASTALGQVLQQGAPQSTLLNSNGLMSDVVNALKAGQQQAVSSTKHAPGIIVTRSGQSTAAAKLAAAYPINARAEVERVFGMLLSTYPQVEQKLGMPANELGGAVALFVVTSLQAYQGRDVEIEQFKTVAAQMRAALSTNAAIAEAPDADKQDVYEQLAILGMFLDGVHEQLKKTPNPQVAANMKQAAKGYLEQFLKTDADALTLTAQGLKIAGTPKTAAAANPASSQPATTKPSAPELTADARADARTIEAVVLDESWTMGIGGSMVLKYRPVVLFADGSYTRDAEKALTNAAKIQSRWRKEGGDYFITDSEGKPKKLRAKMIARPARAKQTLTGRYASMSGLGGGGTGTAMVVAYKDYSFAADGSVRMDRGAGASTNDQTGAAEGTSVVTSSKSGSAGRYSIDEYTITLSLDGKSTQALFYFYPDSDDAIGIGGGTFLKKKK